MITHVACDVLITVNNNGSDNDKCCVNGTCPCSSLLSALHNVSDNTVINITSESVTLHDIVVMGSGNLSHITITGNGATIMCNNTGGVYCESCSNITIMGITWYQCGRNDSNYPITQIPALAFTDVSSEICIQDCTFLSSSGCPVYFHNAKGNISITETKFMSNVFDFVFADNVSVNNIFCAGIYILSNAQIVVAIKNSTFDSNGWILNELSDYFYLYSTVIYSSSDISEFLLKNTNFSNNTHGLYLNAGVNNAVIKILNVNVHDNMGYGINLRGIGRCS